jgi:hypothetical protein
MPIHKREEKKKAHNDQAGIEATQTKSYDQIKV